VPHAVATPDEFCGPAARWPAVHERSKGAVLGAAAITAVSVLWAAVAGRVDDTTCVHFEPVPPEAFVFLGVAVGGPCALFAGAAIGGVAGRLRRLRRVSLVVIAALLACLLTALTGCVLQCSTDPVASVLWPRAFGPLAIGALVLEKWTRPIERVPCVRVV